MTVNFEVRAQSYRQLFFQHIQFVILFEKVRDFLFITGEAHEAMQRTIFREDPQAKMTDKFLVVHNVNIIRVYLLHFACFVALENDICIGHLQATRGLEIDIICVQFYCEIYLNNNKLSEFFNPRKLIFLKRILYSPSILSVRIGSRSILRPPFSFN